MSANAQRTHPNMNLFVLTALSTACFMRMRPRVYVPALLVAAVPRGAVPERAFVAPVSAYRIVDAGLRVEAAEQAAQIFGVLEALLDQGRRIGVVKDVFLEPTIVSQGVIDHAAQERDVAAGPDRDVEVAVRRRPREVRVDVD